MFAVGGISSKLVRPHEEALFLQGELQLSVADHVSHVGIEPRLLRGGAPDGRSARGRVSGLLGLRLLDVPVLLGCSGESAASRASRDYLRPGV